MYKLALIVALLAVTSVSRDADAAPDRDSLISAWEAYIASLPSTATFEKIGDGSYQLSDTELPYEGELLLHGALVRPIPVPGDNIYSHTGMLEFELADLPEERHASQLYYYWIADKQILYYSAQRDEWLSQTEYTADFSGEYDYEYGDDVAFMSFMLKYGIWILLVALIIFIFRGAHTQMKKNRALMDDTAAINEQARENVERAQALQDELLAITRQSLELQAENNETLKRILDAVKR